MDLDTLLALYTATEREEELTELGQYDFSDEALENALAITTLDEGDPKAIAFWSGYFTRKAREGSDLQLIAYHVYECRHWLRPIADGVFVRFSPSLTVPDSLLYAARQSSL